jgi:hypothetical protein
MSQDSSKPNARLSKVKQPKKTLTPSQRKRQQAQAFRPLAIELGWLTYEWNRLHETLGEIFARIVSRSPETFEDSNIKPALAAWHALTSERSQREMLQAAINAYGQTQTPKIHSEISWVLSKLRSLSGKRNDAIHAPMMIVTQFSLAKGEGDVEILPLHFFGNPRAIGLKDKPLLGEFRWYRSHLEMLADYAETLIFATQFSDYALPDRPQLPSRGQFQNRGPRHPKSRAK